MVHCEIIQEIRLKPSRRALKGVNQMKILQVCPRYYPLIGGVEEHVRNISERLARNHEVIVATTDQTGRLCKEETVSGVRIIRFKSIGPTGTFKFYPTLRNYLFKNSSGFDIVHAHNYHALPALYAACAKNGNRLVFTPHYHGTGHTLFRKILHKPYRYFGKMLFDRADGVICVSVYERNLVLRHFGIDPTKAVVIPNGINFKEFHCGLTKRNESHNKILYVGRLEKYKGVQYLIKVLPQLNQNATLEIVGEGPHQRNLRRISSKLRLEKRVRFYEDLERDELLQKYVEADIFVTLSSNESYGICVAEALASGTPCIVNNAAALSEWIDGENCFGIDSPKDLEGLASLINSVMGRNVRSPKLHDWDEIAKDTVRFYEALREERNYG